MVKTSTGNENRDLSNSRENAPVASQITEATLSHQSFRSGPIPSPKEFEGYKKVDPNFPERIFKQFEEDSITNRKLQQEAQAADIELDKKRLEADIAFEKRSQWMAFSLITLGFVGTFVLAYLGKEYTAIVTGLGTLVIIFSGVFSKKQNQLPKTQEDDDDNKKD